MADRADGAEVLVVRAVLEVLVVQAVLRCGAGVPRCWRAVAVRV